MNVDLSKYSQDWYDRGRPGLIIILWWFVQGTFFRMSLHNMYGYRAFILRLFGAKIGDNVKIRASAKFHYPWKVEIGQNSWIGDNVYLYSLDQIVIGDNCVVSQNCYINTGAHNIIDEKFGLITKPVHIKNNAWIAANCFINLGITIEESVVVGAMSNVTKSLPANSICVGNPCAVIRDRFDNYKEKLQLFK